MKVAIIGSRSIDDIKSEFIREHLPQKCSEIISGGSHGVDTLAQKFAADQNIPFRCFLPNYSLYGRIAPIIRNKQIIQHSDFVLVFWDGKSKGSNFVINSCQSEGKPFKVVKC
ncbi:MAG: DUF2493 domain-containing protein [Oscillospiraceae bacterium]|jgi:hypothetical protein|nr:DUF2493 domain-containing protein [Oscillospiraceae bacterium]